MQPDEPVGCLGRLNYDVNVFKDSLIVSIMSKKGIGKITMYFN